MKINIFHSYIIFMMYKPSSHLLKGEAVWFFMGVVVFSFLVFRNILLSENSFLKNNKNIRIQFHFFYMQFFFVGLSLFFSIKYSITNDYNELIRIYSNFLALFISINYSREIDIDWILRFCKFYIIFQTIISILQKINPIKNMLSLFWNMDKAWTLRSTGTLSNPNILAFVTMIFFFFILYFENSNTKKKVFTIIEIFLLILAGSRTGLGVFVGSYFLYIILNTKFTIKSIIRFIFIITVLSFIFIQIFYVIASKNAYIGQLFDLVSDGTIDFTKVNAMNGRLEIWEKAFKIHEKANILQIFIGMGPGKGIGLRYVDNEYFSIYIKYGIFGIVIISLFLIVNVKPFFKKKSKIILKYLFQIIFIFIPSSFFSATFTSVFLMIPYYIMLGMFLNVINNNKKNLIEVNIN